MKSSFKYFKKPAYGGKPGNGSSHKDNGDRQKHSIYMQSRDSNWLNRNIPDKEEEEDPEPIEEDIRD